MLVLPAGLRVFVCSEPVDMRRSFDSLASVTREILQEDPISGHLFVFFSRSWSSVKILHWEKSGYWLYYKRLERGTFKLPVKRQSCRSLEIDSKELSLILEGLDLNGAKQRVRFQREAFCS